MQLIQNIQKLVDGQVLIGHTVKIISFVDTHMAFSLANIFEYRSTCAGSVMSYAEDQAFL